MPVSPEDQQKLLQMSYLQGQSQQAQQGQAQEASAIEDEVLAGADRRLSVKGGHTPARAHPAYSRGSM